MMALVYQNLLFSVHTITWFEHISKLNPKSAYEYLSGSETLQIVQLGAERSKSFIGPTLAHDRDTQRNTVSQVVDSKGVVTPPTHCYWSRPYTVRKPHMYL